MALSSITTVRARANFFVLWLELDSTAEEWFRALPQPVQEDWDQLKTQFTTQWDSQPPPAKMATQKIEELLSCKLKLEEVGTMVPYMGRTQHIHVAWAEEILKKAQVCGLENRMEYIHQVLAELPGSVREGLQWNHMDWTMFVDNVKAVDVDQLMERAESEKTIKELTAMVKDLSMDRRVERQVGSQRAQQYRTIQQTIDPGIGRGNTTMALALRCPGPYTTSAPRNSALQPPAMEVEKVDMRQYLMLYPHQPDTDAGQATYRHQLAQWSAIRAANDPVTHVTLVPLRLGTAAVCSGECYRCGTHGHRVALCLIPDGHTNQLTPEESRWHVICTSVLGQTNRVAGSQVYLVASEMEVWQEWDTGE
jgi:hypothetical protein